MMKKFKIELTEKGKTIFKGGNIEVMEKALIDFEAEDDKEAYKKYYSFILENFGSSQFTYFCYKVKE